jgi:hypothetical protein
MACEIMLQRGKTRPNMLSARLERAADAIIARHYTCAGDFPNALSSWLGNRMFVARIPYAGRIPARGRQPLARQEEETVMEFHLSIRSICSARTFL